VQIDWHNEPQPDALLMLAPERGGQARVGASSFIEGAPELIVEVSASTISYDLHEKFQAYERNGVREYVVWRVLDRELDWFVLREGRYVPLSRDAEGILRSEVFPGLWLDPAALIAGDLARVLQVVQQGTASPEHAAFIR
jgi:Uma2 family endonuclease